MLRLSELLGRRVLTSEGSHVGRLEDFVIRLAPQPRVVRLRVAGKHVVEVSWASVATLDSEPIELAGDAELVAPNLAHDELLAARHVLDAQIIDQRGKDLTRVGDIELDVEGAALTIVGVEVGARPLLRRLGLRWLAGRTESRSIPWPELHLDSHRGRIVQLAASGGVLPDEQHPSHSELVERLAPQARRRRFPFRWIRRATT